MAGGLRPVARPRPGARRDGPARRRRLAHPARGARQRSPGPSPPTATATRSSRDAYGHDHLWWLDRMVRTNQPLVERMTLVWHDWFSTSNDGVGQQSLMLAQNELFRRNAFGSFDQLAARRDAGPGDDRLAQPERERALEPERELRARADGAVHARRRPRRLHRAGRAQARSRAHRVRLRVERRARDVQLPLRAASGTTTGSKTVFGQTGAFTWEQGVGMCVRHPMHPGFFVNKLWSYFIATAPSDSDRPALESLYVSGGTRCGRCSRRSCCTGLPRRRRGW